MFNLQSYSVGVTAVAVVAIAILLVVVFSGCSAAQGPYGPLKDAVVATDGGVETTSTLITAQLIKPADVKPVLIAAKTLRASEGQWKDALDKGDTNAATIAASSAQAGLKALLIQLQAMQTNKNLPLHPEQGRMMLKHASGDAKKAGEISAALAILQLVTDLTPKIVDWVNTMNSKNLVTSADVQAALDTLDRDIVLLDSVVNQ